MDERFAPGPIGAKLTAAGRLAYTDTDLQIVSPDG
jgi:hypothetical protein